MRHLQYTIGRRVGARIALACAACLILPAAGLAQEAPQRAPLAVEVRPTPTPPAWLDPPNVVIPNNLPGSQQRLAFQETILAPNRALIHRRDRGGRDLLPGLHAFEPPNLGR